LTGLRVDNLGDELDLLIRGLPESIFSSPDEAWCTPDLSADPVAVLAELRDRAGPIVARDKDGRYGGVFLLEPFGQDAATPQFVALTYDAIHEIAVDSSRFPSERAYRSSQEIQGRTINTRDGVEHTRMRRLFDQTLFGRGQTEEYLETLIAPTVDYLVGRMEARLKRGEPRWTSAAIWLCRRSTNPAPPSSGFRTTDLRNSSPWEKPRSATTATRSAHGRPWLR
jgi:hypothetical protein